jgi:hypothetical protein
MSAQRDVVTSGMPLANINVIGLLLSCTEVLSGPWDTAATGKIRKDLQI